MSQRPASPALEEARRAHSAGSPTRAIPIYERALEEDAENPDILSAYGLALVEAGRPTDAEAPLRRAVEIDPSRPGFRVNLAELYFKVGETELAIDTLKNVTAEHQSFARAFARLGRAHVEKQELAAAANALDRALQLDPNDQSTGLLLARTLAAQQNYGAAYYVLDHLERVNPNDVEAIRFRLEIAIARRDFQALDALAERLTKLLPDDPQGWRGIATARYEDGRYEDALAALERALRLEPKTAEGLSQFAMTAIQALDFAKAEVALDEAEALDPGNARLLSTKALLRTYQGRKEEAEAYCRRCIEAAPHFVSVYPQLSVLRDGWLSDEEEANASAILENPALTPGSRAIAAYVVAHNRDARGDIEGAFATYLRANSLAQERNRAENLRYDYDGHAAWTDAILDVFRGPAPIVGESHHEGVQPIFIIGLPRCGSTLVESVISAHSEVDAGGEMPMMPNMFNPWLKANYRLGEAALLPAERRAAAERYMRGIPARFTKPRFTDKNLLNLEAAGFIAQVFPKAVIINVRRNPVENGLAIWRQDMLKFWAWTTSFDDIAKRYGLYAKLVDHFERVLPERFHTIQYEDFVRGFDAEAKKLIALCGLKWEEGCRDFQKARAVAPTISAIQVRGDVSLKGERAGAYGSRIDPLRRALEAQGVDLATGALKR
jgi:tetratricopeptide (TPR) repeat protein